MIITALQALTFSSCHQFGDFALNRSLSKGAATNRELFLEEILVKQIYHVQGSWGHLVRNRTAAGY
jgi:hypothetical protein